ncbi:hypothetical protein CWE08_08065 [Aliidiomarina iranensis]|uniref:Uncharacterized protein n=1 Tax=Aliidiomarina iranensis TaxID=1434071 RepID=A0A432VV95_9GAMM|nr:hypothetical protein CWE08_08065 [Aliidiomarina iranensis]
MYSANALKKTRFVHGLVILLAISINHKKTVRGTVFLFRFWRSLHFKFIETRLLAFRFQNCCLQTNISLARAARNRDALLIYFSN